MNQPHMTDLDQQISRQSYHEQLKQAEWLQKRQEILIRDGHRCRNCGAVSGLQIHHRQYHVTNGTYQKPWEYDHQYLVTLCERCHKTGHQNYKVPVFNV